MSRDSQHHTPGVGPTFPAWKPPVIPALIVCVGALFALLVWSLPNWELFAQNVSRFPFLWQVEANRRAMLLLVFKVYSPLIVGLQLAACCWLWTLIQPFLPAQGRTSQNQRTFHHIQPTTTNVQVAGGARKRRQIDPETPLPPMTHISSTELGQHNGERMHWNAGPSSSRTGEVSAQQAELLQRRHQQYHGGIASTGTQTVQDALLPSPDDAQQKNAADGEDRGIVAQGVPSTPIVAPSRLGQERPYEVTITLLKKVGMRIETAQGISRDVPLPLNAKRVQLLAYIAWLCGQPVNRDRMLEQVFGHGKDDEDATREKLGEAFDSHKKLLRNDLRETIRVVNEEIGVILIPPDLDIMTHKGRLWSLAEICHVADVEVLEACHKIIELARKDGLLVDQVPDYVKEACDQLIATYAGDFLEELVTDYLDEFEPWAGSWARKPYTLYRDYYLQAVWYAAEYEVRQGQQFADERIDAEGEANRKEQRKHWGQAAQLYRTYAMSCNSRFDMKVTFGGGGREPGERVVMSERALRRCLVLYGSIGATYQVDQVYAAYNKQMRSISAKAWEPSSETLADLRSAKSQTNAYRFSPQVMQQTDTHQEIPA